MMARISRWVERTGCQVKFGNIIMGYCGKPHIYEFPNEKDAKRFEALVSKKDKNGIPNAVPEERWAKRYYKGSV
jgi:hypothetical protein